VTSLTTRTLDYDERRDWLRLIRSENIGPATFGQLLARFGDAASAIKAVPDLAQRGGRRLNIVERESAERELEAADAFGARFVAMIEPDYPAPLAAIAAPPPVICVLGRPDCLNRGAVAVVGSRNASITGIKMATNMAGGIGRAGYAVASGLARGIDSAAHKGSIDTGTIAVMAGGLDLIYPPENLPLAEEIVEAGGALVTEMPMGHRARGKDFPRRNRIISGLSVAVVVVEAARRSGSLITARMAAEQGRPVYAIPGSPLDPRAEGTNLLIREGATLVTAPEDILADIEPMVAREPEPADRIYSAPEFATSGDEEDADGDARTAIITALGPSPVTTDDIVRFTGLSPAIVHLVVMELSLAGKLEHHGGQRVSLTGG
jgi:DNA processing protein